MLLLETSGPVTSVALAADGVILAVAEQSEPNGHAGKITVLVEAALRQAGLEFSALDAVAISAGPGSYTGLRIGASAAKGFCYALSIPLIAIDTLEAMFHGQLERRTSENTLDEPDFYCPVIDARRLEVFYAVYARDGNCQSPGATLIVEPDSFKRFSEGSILFFGSGAKKMKLLGLHLDRATFLPDFCLSATALSALAEEKYQKRQYENLIDFEPFYLKDFYTPPTGPL